jgi:hypothetical protein
MAAAVLFALVCGLSIYACARDDGEPDPPLQTLIPCDPDAGVDDPLACAPVDAGIDGATLGSSTQPLGAVGPPGRGQ